MNLPGNNKTVLHSSKEFEQHYIDLRIHEKRIYSDEEVLWLPEVGDDHIHRDEWKIRKASCERLTKYLLNKKRAFKILEVGCGNGWFSYHLSQIPYSTVVGLDINLAEISQAQRVFAVSSNLNFVYGDLYSVNHVQFDIIVFAASIQYFSSFKNIAAAALEMLNPWGEIHIVDTHFYDQSELDRARQRSRAYFQSRGFDEMRDFYFHRSLKDLDGFNFKILSDPNSIVNRLVKKRNPFHWIRIEK